MSRRLPFPFPMGIGTDICHMPRIKALLTGPRSVKFIKRILHPKEYRASPVAHIVDPTVKPGAYLPAYSSEPADADPQVVLQRAVNFMAGRFAAKEAVIKAHSFANMNDYGAGGYRKATFQSIQIVPQRNKSLIAVVWPLEDGTDHSLRPPQEALVSISHEGEYATAMCLAYRHPDEQGDQTRTEKARMTGNGDVKRNQERTKKANVTDDGGRLIRKVKRGRSFLLRHPFAKWEYRKLVSKAQREREKAGEKEGEKEASE
ncbi:hypothetical protein DL546_002886 [Coniochaeta pulveracea]|uniref:4'-phosphopantetheinyl transferase domain-containing protein n=1 Tax=Coniochaeta pulveracea TaxID=177199 RepID=A0A420YE93_9PEZI|nr:hypothetical protein DL546_002886 [Coniochaeta pulveracea]